MQNDERDEYDMIWRMAYLQGLADARCQCDVCPSRGQQGLPVLVSGADLMRRPAIEN